MIYELEISKNDVDPIDIKALTKWIHSAKFAGNLGDAILTARDIRNGTTLRRDVSVVPKDLPVGLLMIVIEKLSAEEIRHKEQQELWDLQTNLLERGALGGREAAMEYCIGVYEGRFMTPGAGC
jgi:hypothetical protein